MFEGLKHDFIQSFIVGDRWKLYISGITVTIRVAILALILGVIIGVIIAVIRSMHDSTKRPNFILKILNLICSVYLTIIRGTPMMVQLMIMYFVIFANSRSLILVASLAFGINSGAYVAEIVRGGIMSVDQGQMEAGRSLGLTYSQTMRMIIIPQAMKAILPALGNEMITLLKDTSLVTVIGLRDITKTAVNIQSVTYLAYMPFIMAAIIYLVIVIALSKLLAVFERRMRASDRR